MPGRIDAIDKPYIAEALGERPTDVARRLRDNGLLLSAPPEAFLDATFRLPELQAMAGNSGLKRSGRKTEVVARLVASDPSGYQAKAERSGLVVCSATAAAQVRVAMEAQRIASAAVERVAMEHLQARRFEAAAHAVVEHEASRLLPRGLNMDWSSPATAADLVARVKTVFGPPPAILGHVLPRELEQLRVVTGMRVLFGDFKPAWWEAGTEALGRFDAETASRMLLARAYYVRDLVRLRDVARSVAVSGIDDFRSCPACRRMDQREFPIEAAPELPNPTCTSPIGCRCQIVSARRISSKG